MDADNSFYVKFIATEAPTFFGYIILVLAMVRRIDPPDTRRVGANLPTMQIY